jgi:hypothetical protein
MFRNHLLLDAKTAYFAFTLTKKRSLGMSEAVERIQARARELAGSGKFAGWRALAFELQFESGFFDAYGWLYSPSTKAELEALCLEARTHRQAQPPKE